MVDQVISKQDIARSFGRAAMTYDSAAHFQRWAGERLLEIHQPDNPERILDLGCGTGYFSRALQEQCPHSSYLGLDLSENMLCYAKDNHQGSLWLAGDAESLPFADDSLDLIFSSLAIQWCESLPRLFKEIQRVLSPGGCFMFSTLLDGTLAELKRAWSEVDQVEQHVNEFPFFEDYQAVIQESSLSEVCLQQEEKVLAYHQVKELTQELKMLGAHNIRSERPKHLTGKARIKAFVSAYEAYRNEQGLLPATYQMLFGVVKK